MNINHELIKDWKNPSYREVIFARGELVEYMTSFGKHNQAIKDSYKDRPIDFINHFLWTFDPRNEKARRMPFILFPRQEEYINWLYDCFKGRNNGIVMKSRDLGASWLNCAFAVWVFIMQDDANVTMGSRKEAYVDNLGNIDSLLEKCRFMLRTMPKFMIPDGFDLNKNMGYLKIINPKSGAAIKGEAGDNIGRGGRSSILMLDEAAFIERPMLVEAAISQTSDCIIYTSTPKGGNDWFYKKWERGALEKFRFRWQEDPRKDQEWYDLQKSILDPVIMATEIDGDVNISFENVVISNQFIQAALDLNYEAEGKIIAGFDVADEGRDKNALFIRHGSKGIYLDEWSHGDTSQSAQKVYHICEKYKVDVINYDAIGVGAGVKAEFNKLIRKAEENDLPYKPVINGIHIGSRKLPGFYVESKKNKDMFYNLKAKVWWELRNRFQKSYDYVKGKGDKPDTDEIISLPYNADLVDQLSAQQYEFKDTGTIVMKSKKELYAKSPNLADAVVLSFASTGYTQKNIFVI